MRKYPSHVFEFRGFREHLCYGFPAITTITQSLYGAIRTLRIILNAIKDSYMDKYDTGSVLRNRVDGQKLEWVQRCHFFW
jgi:hypothetical protein